MVLFGLAALVGCQTPGPVVKDLPDPYVVQRPSQAPPTVAPPTPTVRPTPTTRSLRGATIVVDAGHGGIDPGAWKGTASRLPEKTIVMDIAEHLAGQLDQWGARTIMTRTTDVKIPLEERAAIADRHKADLLVSIHADSAENRSATGTGTYVARQASSESLRAARSIGSALRRAGIKYRGMNRANFVVVADHSRPAVLVECGFLTNTADAARLNSASHRAELAAAIAQGIADHFGK